jgi:A/G-specific adenine glycosylase
MQRWSCNIQSSYYEFGALQCVPKVQTVPYVFLILAVLHCKEKVDQLPVKSKKIKVRNRYFNYIVVADANNDTVIVKNWTKSLA